jgi:hypothetical protein
MRVLLMALDAFDDLVLIVVERLCILVRPVFQAPFRPFPFKLQFLGNAIGIEIEKDAGCRAIVMSRLA